MLFKLLLNGSHIGSVSGSRLSALDADDSFDALVLLCAAAAELLLAALVALLEPAVSQRSCAALGGAYR